MKTAIAPAAALFVSVSSVTSAQQPAENTQALPSAETPTAASNPEPFDFKGIRLGMTVSEFKAAPLPVPTGDNTIPVCTNESGVLEVSVSGDDAQIGLKKCAWVRFAGARGGASAVRPLVVGASPKGYQLQFIAKPGDAEPRLFWIAFRLFSDQYDGIVAALAERFGKPSEAQQSTIQNRMGATFANNILRWQNASGMISATRRADDVDTMELVYVQHEYLDYALSKRTELRRSRGPGL